MAREKQVKNSWLSGRMTAPDLPVVHAACPQDPTCSACLQSMSLPLLLLPTLEKRRDPISWVRKLRPRVKPS